MAPYYVWLRDEMNRFCDPKIDCNEKGTVYTNRAFIEEDPPNYEALGLIYSYLNTGDSN